MVGVSDLICSILTHGNSKKSLKMSLDTKTHISKSLNLYRTKTNPWRYFKKKIANKKEKKKKEQQIWVWVVGYEAQLGDPTNL